MDKKRGLYGRYVVLRTKRLRDVDEVVDANDVAVVREPCFVLMFDDPHAQRALHAYADSCEAENPKLAADLRMWVPTPGDDS